MKPHRDKHELGENDVKKPMVKLTKPGRKVARAVVRSYALQLAAVAKTVVKRRMKMRRKP